MRISFSGGSIRPWKAGDAAPLVPLADNRAIWRNLRDGFPSPYRLADAKRWIKQASEKPVTHFALECEGSLCGGIGLILGKDIHARSAELGYWLGEPFWGRGLMTGAVRAFTDAAFASFGIRRVFALVLEWNPASMRVLEKSGFAREGRLSRSACKDGKMADELLYARVG